MLPAACRVTFTTSRLSQTGWPHLQWRRPLAPWRMMQPRAPPPLLGPGLRAVVRRSSRRSRRRFAAPIVGCALESTIATGHTAMATQISEKTLVVVCGEGGRGGEGSEEGCGGWYVGVWCGWGWGWCVGGGEDGREGGRERGREGGRTERRREGGRGVSRYFLGSFDGPSRPGWN